MHLPLSAKTAVASAVMLLTMGAAHADITAYTTQSSYLSAVGNTGVDTYDDLEIDQYDGPQERFAGSYGYTATTGPNAENFWGAGDTASDSWLTGQNRLDSIVFTFADNNIAGAGGFFFGSDLFGFSTPADSITIIATETGGATLSYTINAPELNSFVGFVSSSSLTSLEVLVGDQPGVWATVNDLHLSIAAVPEPETYGMMLAGLGLLGYAARRQKRKS